MFTFHRPAFTLIFRRQIPHTVDHPSIFPPPQRRILHCGIASWLFFPTQPPTQVRFIPVTHHIGRSMLELNLPSRNFAMAAAMIMNSNSLPVALLQSLAVSVPGLEWGQNDTPDAMVGRALTYLLLSGTMGQFVSSFFKLKVVSRLTTQFIDPLELWSSFTLQSSLPV